MKNQREIYEALLAGETLISVDFATAKLVDGKLFNDVGEQSVVAFIQPEIWQIFKESKWYENIPDGGVLCYCKDRAHDGTRIINVTAYREDHYQSMYSTWKFAKPLTKQEIQVFMDNAPEEI